MTAIAYDGKMFVADTGVTVNEYCVGEVDKVKTYFCTAWDGENAKFGTPVVVIVAAAGDRSNYEYLTKAIYDFVLGDANHLKYLAVLTDEHNAMVLALPLDEQGQPTSRRMFLVNNREIVESKDQPMAVGFMATYFRMGMLLGHTAEELMIPVVGRYRCVGPRYRVFDVDKLASEAKTKGIKHYKHYLDEADEVSDPAEAETEVSIETYRKDKNLNSPIASSSLRVAEKSRPPIAPPSGRVVQEGGPLFYSRLWAWFTGLFR